MLLFEGLKVLDVGTFIAGPVSATILADFGADVIKVEMPGQGDPYRQLPSNRGTPDADVNYTWILDGRNKRSITLDLKTAEGMEVLSKLIAGCDVYVTNQPLGVRRALGLRYEDIKGLNEKMIFASLTAYGESGDEAEKTGFDGVAYWARSGLADIIQAPGSLPSASIAGMGDHPTAVSMFACIMMGLYKRQMTGKGGEVSTSLLANGYWSASCLGQAALAGADFSVQRESAGTNRTWVRYPYLAADDRRMMLYMVRTNSEQQKLLEALGLGELLSDPRFIDVASRLDHSAELRDILAAKFAERDSDYWLEFLVECGVNVSRVAHLEDMLEDKQAMVTGVLSPPIEDVGVPWVISPPLFAEGVEKVGATRPPEVGEHTDEVLHELGYADAQIDEWRAQGKI